MFVSFTAVPYFQYILTLTVIAFLHPFLVYRWSNNYMTDYIIYNFRKKYKCVSTKRKSWIFYEILWDELQQYEVYDSYLPNFLLVFSS